MAFPVHFIADYFVPSLQHFILITVLAHSLKFLHENKHPQSANKSYSKNTHKKDNNSGCFLKSYKQLRVYI